MQGDESVSGTLGLDYPIPLCRVKIQIDPKDFVDQYDVGLYTSNLVALQSLEGYQTESVQNRKISTACLPALLQAG